MQKDKNLEYWEVFRAVASGGSISGASEQFGLDPSAVSRIISALEKSLGGIPLFDRSLHPMRLTDNGEKALELSSRMLALHAEMRRTLTRSSDLMAGVLRVGVPPGLLHDVLVPPLTDFAHRYPEIDLEIHEYTAGVPVNFETPYGMLDTVLCYGPDTVHQNYVQQHCMKVRFVPCASPAYLEKRGWPRDPSELSAHTGVIFQSRMRPVRRVFLRDGAEKPFFFGREMVFASPVIAKIATVLGNGINPGIPWTLCEREIARGELVRVFGWELEPRDCFIVTRPESVKLRRVREFIGEFRRFMSRFDGGQPAA